MFTYRLYLTLVTTVATATWKKVASIWKAQVIILSCYQKNPSCLKELGIPFISGFYIRFVYFLLAL